MSTHLEVRDLFVIATLVSTFLSVAIITWYFVAEPALTIRTKAQLFLAIVLFPLAGMVTGNAAGLEATKERRFCASCHVMTPYAEEAADPANSKIAGIHSRNHYFGNASCYTCHADYSLFGTFLTKLNGMHHMEAYYTKYWNKSKEEMPEIKLYKPFPNTTCMQCHSTTLQGWLDEPEHEVVVDEVRSGETSCASSGCHGPSHGIKPVAPEEGEGESGDAAAGEDDDSSDQGE